MAAWFTVYCPRPVEAVTAGDLAAALGPGAVDFYALAEGFGIEDDATVRRAVVALAVGPAAGDLGEWLQVHYRPVRYRPLVVYRWDDGDRVREGLDEAEAEYLTGRRGRGRRPGPARDGKPGPPVGAPAGRRRRHWPATWRGRPRSTPGSPSSGPNSATGSSAGSPTPAPRTSSPTNWSVFATCSGSPRRSGCSHRPSGPTCGGAAWPRSGRSPTTMGRGSGTPTRSRGQRRMGGPAARAGRGAGRVGEHQPADAVPADHQAGRPQAVAEAVPPTPGELRDGPVGRVPHHRGDRVAGAQPRSGPPPLRPGARPPVRAGGGEGRRANRRRIRRGPERT